MQTRRAQPAQGRARPGHPAARPVGHRPADRARRRRLPQVLVAVPGRPREGRPELVGVADPPAPRRVPGAAQGRAALLLRPARSRRRRRARCGTRSATRARSARRRTRRRRRSSPSASTRDTDLDCDVCVVGSGAGGGTAAARAGPGGSRRGRPRGGRLLLRGGLRRRRAARLRAALPERRRAGQPRPVDRPAGGLLPGRGDRRQLHVLVQHARPRPRGVGPARRRRRHQRRLRPQHGGGRRADRRQPRAQHPVGPRQGDEGGVDKLGWHVDSMPRNVRGARRRSAATATTAARSAPSSRR